MKLVEIYTDGACSVNPGSGGWCAILIYKGVEKIISGGEPLTTNNRMELTAVLEGLKALKEPCEVKIYSDSSYVVSAFEEGWINRWQMFGWRKSSKSTEGIKNIDIWKDLYEEVYKHKCTFIKVKGHSDNEYNNHCDKIASQIAQAGKTKDKLAELSNE